ncbi:bifunctional tetrahydrofolate synthase/dihydrofolate synthase [Kangiella sp.]|uniref:bifunctional tetrahydrofolate synthase/dihydrofolate synthase n=1 Tax=Kangiella sp. TaxID=1920245 RepID=UPI0019A9E9AF|nr:bifunctional tetrahydrofolate synthase/dihydrofolate synthase [Kangiella sp.]MBD3652922.1 bifunctional tetrahydrofolate synthase/dihydrofolate synthase [Kangiella sp.]
MSASPDFDTLAEWIAWLEQAHPIHHIELGLSRIKQVAERLDLLELNCPVITVAGTNGKGTVVAALESIAIEHGLCVASYTSPHLLKFNERIKFDGQSVTDAELVSGFKAIAQQQQDIPLTYFEFTTLVAFWLFKQRSLDLVALEVGLGGRMDAVNIIDPDVAVITSIGLDHVAWLGDTLEKVAHEKAGIMRAQTPVVIADPATDNLLLPEVADKQAISYLAQDDYLFREADQGWDFKAEIKGKTYSFSDLPNNDLLISNLAAALQAFTLLFSGVVSESALQLAFQKLQFVGRFQYLSREPLVIVDVAHNPDSARVLNEKLEQLKHRGVERVSAICGMLKDKDITSCLAHCTAVDYWYCIDLSGPRGAKADELVEKLPEFARNNAKSYHLLVDAFEDYWQHQLQNEALVVFGSFVTVGLMLETWDELKQRLITSA